MQTWAILWFLFGSSDNYCLHCFVCWFGAVLSYWCCTIILYYYFMLFIVLCCFKFVVAADFWRGSRNNSINQQSSIVLIHTIITACTTFFNGSNSYMCYWDLWNDESGVRHSEIIFADHLPIAVASKFSFYSRLIPQWAIKQERCNSA